MIKKILILLSSVLLLASCSKTEEVSNYSGLKDANECVSIAKSDMEVEDSFEDYGLLWVSIYQTPHANPGYSTYCDVNMLATKNGKKFLVQYAIDTDSYTRSLRDSSEEFVVELFDKFWEDLPEIPEFVLGEDMLNLAQKNRQFKRDLLQLKNVDESYEAGPSNVIIFSDDFRAYRTRIQLGIEHLTGSVAYTFDAVSGEFLDRETYPCSRVNSLEKECLLEFDN